MIIEDVLVSCILSVQRESAIHKQNMSPPVFCGNNIHKFCKMTNFFWMVTVDNPASSPCLFLHSSPHTFKVWETSAEEVDDRVVFWDIVFLLSWLYCFWERLNNTHQIWSWKKVVFYGDFFGHVNSGFLCYQSCLCADHPSSWLTQPNFLTIFLTLKIYWGLDYIL